MNLYTQVALVTMRGSISDKLRRMNWERAAVTYARFALAAAFLSAVTSRF